MSDLTDAYQAHQEAQLRPVATLAELRRQIALRRAEGASWGAIGNELGVTRQRAQRIMYPKGAQQ